jgi:hypothetical protein
MLCEEGMTTAKARSALLIPQNTKHATPPKTHSNTRKTNKYCTNCKMNNHNVETCKKKEHTTMGATKAAQQIQKPHNTFSYACHICGLNGHKMTDYPKFIEMQKIFHGKSVTIAKVQLVAKIKPVTTYVNVVDVNVITRSKATKKHVFKDKNLRKTKSVDDWEKEERLKKSIVETIQQIQKTQTQTKGPSTSMEGWNTTWPSMPNTTPIEAHKS